MIFTFIKYLVLGIFCVPPILLFILLVPTTYRKYWAGWVYVGSDRHGTGQYGYYWGRKTLLWRLSILSLNWGIPQPEYGGWQERRDWWLEANGFKKECSWIGDVEEEK